MFHQRTQNYRALAQDTNKRVPQITACVRPGHIFLALGPAPGTVAATPVCANRHLTFGQRRGSCRVRKPLAQSNCSMLIDLTLSSSDDEELPKKSPLAAAGNVHLGPVSP